MSLDVNEQCQNGDANGPASWHGPWARRSWTGHGSSAAQTVSRSPQSAPARRPRPAPRYGPWTRGARSHGAGSRHGPSPAQTVSGSPQSASASRRSRSASEDASASRPRPPAASYGHVRPRPGGGSSPSPGWSRVTDEHGARLPPHGAPVPLVPAAHGPQPHVTPPHVPTPQHVSPSFSHAPTLQHSHSPTFE